MVAASLSAETRWRSLLLGAAVAAAFALAFHDGLAELFRIWSNTDEYSHGWLIAPITAFLLWQRRDEIAAGPRDGAGWGVALCAAGLGVFLVGELATLFVLVHYGMVAVLWGLFIAAFGLPAARRLWAPLLFLVFMVPLPPFLYNKLSTFLQLVSSELGVQFIKLCGISVYLEGNVIDLGSYQLQVVEACNGLRYLFPLMSFGFICAYLFQAPVWQRLVVFLSTIPITVAMNSFRIGVIGVLVEHWGVAMAEGFLHDFEGWAIFMVCVGILFLEMWLLTALTRRGVPLRDVFWPAEPGGTKRSWAVAPQIRATVAALCLLAVAGAAGHLAGGREEAIPPRQHFSAFPLELDHWDGTRDRLEQHFVDALKFTDYILANYHGGGLVNFYAAYYASQRKGESAHSPQSCIPGGGWKITGLEARDLDGVRFAGQPARVNRVMIQKGETRQLVYYWFQQRGRIITNEYLVKAYLLWDSITRNRSDGALVRLTTPIPPGQSWESGDARLESFARALSGRLEPYVPG